MGYALSPRVPSQRQVKYPYDDAKVEDRLSMPSDEEVDRQYAGKQNDSSLSSKCKDTSEAFSLHPNEDGSVCTANTKSSFVTASVRKGLLFKKSRARKSRLVKARATRKRSGTDGTRSITSSDVSDEQRGPIDSNNSVQDCRDSADHSDDSVFSEVQGHNVRVDEDIGTGISDDPVLAAFIEETFRDVEIELDARMDTINELGAIVSLQQKTIAILQRERQSKQDLQQSKEASSRLLVYQDEQVAKDYCCKSTHSKGQQKQSPMPSKLPTGTCVDEDEEDVLSTISISDLPSWSQPVEGSKNEYPNVISINESVPSREDSCQDAEKNEGRDSTQRAEASWSNVDVDDNQDNGREGAQMKLVIALEEIDALKCELNRVVTELEQRNKRVEEVAEDIRARRNRTTEVKDDVDIVETNASTSHQDSSSDTKIDRFATPPRQRTYEDTGDNPCLTPVTENRSLSGGQSHSTCNSEVPLFVGGRRKRKPKKNRSVPAPLQSMGSPITHTSDTSRPADSDTFNDSSAQEEGPDILQAPSFWDRQSVSSRSYSSQTRSYGEAHYGDTSSNVPTYGPHSKEEWNILQSILTQGSDADELEEEDDDEETACSLNTHDAITLERLSRTFSSENSETGNKAISKNGHDGHVCVLKY